MFFFFSALPFYFFEVIDSGGCGGRTTPPFCLCGPLVFENLPLWIVTWPWFYIYYNIYTDRVDLFGDFHLICIHVKTIDFDICQYHHNNVTSLPVTKRQLYIVPCCGRYSLKHTVTRRFGFRNNNRMMTYRELWRFDWWHCLTICIPTRRSGDKKIIIIVPILYLLFSSEIQHGASYRRTRSDRVQLGGTIK